MSNLVQYSAYTSVMWLLELANTQNGLHSEGGDILCHFKDFNVAENMSDTQSRHFYLGDSLSCSRMVPRVIRGSLQRPAAAHKVSAEVDVSTVFRLLVRPSALPAAV